MIYDDETARQLFIEAKSVYHDRGMMKWNSGFFTSELIEAERKSKEEYYKVNPKKERMESADIERIIYTARIKDRPVAIQLEALDTEGHYFDDIIGKIAGYDGLGIYIDGQKIDYDEIRNVEFFVSKKWSFLDDPD